jgi:hypothetical protein
MVSMSVYTDRRKILLGAMTATVATILIGGIIAYQTSIAQNSSDSNSTIQQKGLTYMYLLTNTIVNI